MCFRVLSALGYIVHYNPASHSCAAVCLNLGQLNVLAFGLS